MTPPTIPEVAPKHVSLSPEHTIRQPANLQLSIRPLIPSANLSSRKGGRQDKELNIRLALS
jgi:hypothetical protein